MNSKLTPEQVAALRRRYAQGGVTLQRLADEYGIHRGHASRIVRGKSGNQLPTVPAVFQRILDAIR
jgi:transcriptional regulator with XRE-family HTH domain